VNGVFSGKCTECASGTTLFAGTCSGGSVPTPVLPSPSPAPVNPANGGASCATDAQCTSGQCRRGYCCAPGVDNCASCSDKVGSTFTGKCTECAAGTLTGGVCVLPGPAYGPGRACAGDSECANGQCRRGFCCAPGISSRCLSCSESVSGVFTGRCTECSASALTNGNCV
jgi:hypothetical protein